jgi:hypothetical protein
MAWRVAKALEVLRSQINATYPSRNKSSDGTVGDAKHASRASDHNPWVKDGKSGVVTAMDITHDPRNGVDAGVIAERLRLSRDKRIKYLISNGRIASYQSVGGKAAWIWRPYSGSNGHYKHFHVSARAEKALYDEISPWRIGVEIRPPVVTFPPPTSPKLTGITATVFGGPDDPQMSAYGGAVNGAAPGVALPNRLTGKRLQVRVTHAGKSVVCAVVDVGPWNTADPYWLTGARPQAESGYDTRGRKTNGAGIDLTPAAADAIELPGKGLVEWEFV